MFDVSKLNFEKGNGLVTVVAQDARTGAVLMVAHADKEALERTVSTGKMHYRSRTRGLWLKGETSGNTQAVISLEMDCDGDAVLARVLPAGPACHLNTYSCFAESGPLADVLSALDATVSARMADEKGAAKKPSYTQKLLADRNLRLKKVGEEAAELVLACADGDTARAAEEGADLVYHLLVALRALGVGWDGVRGVLHQRASK
jgi:phosphoribosyl-ATP pyrophosphohydrolase/phosphoribosyl-AMP cyclohydrolase